MSCVDQNLFQGSSHRLRRLWTKGPIGPEGAPRITGEVLTGEVEPAARACDSCVRTQIRARYHKVLSRKESAIQLRRSGPCHIACRHQSTFDEQGLPQEQGGIVTQRYIHLAMVLRPLAKARESQSCHHHFAKDLAAVGLFRKLAYVVPDFIGTQPRRLVEAESNGRKVVHHFGAQKNQFDQGGTGGR